MYTTKSVMYRRGEGTQEKQLENKISRTGGTEENKRGEGIGREEEFHQMTAAVVAMPESTRDYTALPDLHGAPRNGDHIAFKVVTHDSFKLPFSRHFNSSVINIIRVCKH